MLISPPSTLCLPFANTRYWRGTDQPTEELVDWHSLLQWLENNGALDAKTRRVLMTSRAGEALFAAALALRETLYRLFAAIAADTGPEPRDVAALQVALAAAPGRRLAQTSNGFAWQFEADDTSLAALVAPVLWSAGDLLTGDAARRLRLCNNEKCIYLFVDNSRAGARRWCDMKACGNRAKAHRHYVKTKAA
jgi:predicted RNA-binding Zn ribbon-like protein